MPTPYASFESAYQKLIANDKKFSSLILEHYTASEVATIFKTLADNTHLRNLTIKSFADVELDQLGYQNLGDALEKNTGLKKLCLSTNTLTPKAIKPIAKGLSHNHTLETLDVSFNMKLSDKGLVILMNGLRQHQSLKNLELYETKMGKKGAGALADWLEKNQSLQLLNLGKNDLTLKGFRWVMKALSHHPKIKVLLLDRCGLNNESAYALADLLSQQKNLTELYARFNDISDAGITAIAEAISHTKKLKILYLLNNPIGEPGAYALQKMAIDYPRLKIVRPYILHKIPIFRNPEG